ncbi:MAG: hypothetical protein Q9209_007305 [Squamulea sp. 1 TL-2023]
MALHQGPSEQSSRRPTRTESTAYDAQAPWTTARCLRLLRPLSSKITLLRKERQSNPVTEELLQGRSSPIGLNLRQQGQAPDQEIRRRAVIAGDAADEKWSPNTRPRKKLKRTYSSKRLASIQSIALPYSGKAEGYVKTSTEITIPDNLFHPDTQPCTHVQASDSPQVIEHASTDDTFEQKPGSRNGGKPSCLPWPGAPRSHYHVKLPFQRKLTDGICNGLEALLKTTWTQEITQPRGSLSLLTTCLRRVPEYIAQEELWNKMEDPENDVDVSSFIYSDLESFSTSNAGGWIPLRQVVRAHGVNMVGSAISEGLIEVDIARDILRRCLILRAFDEAQHILQCLIHTVEPLQKSLKIPLGTRSILQSLDAFVLATGRHSFRYRKLTWLLGTGRLPLGWIGRPDMTEIWNKVVQSITQNDNNAGPAIDLFRLATCMTYGWYGHRPATFIHGIRLQRQGFAKEANTYIVNLGYQTRWPQGSQLAIHQERQIYDGKASTTISNLMTVLCAIGLLRSARQASSSSHLDPPGMTALQDIAVDAQQMFELASDRVLSIRDDRTIVPLIGAGLVKATLCQSLQTFAANVPALFERLSDLGDMEVTLEEGGSFLCAVAVCCARATHDQVFDHTKEIVQHIHRIAKSLVPCSTSHELCNRLGLRAAFEYAETTKNPKHLHWALDVEQAVLGAHFDYPRRTPAKTPRRGLEQTHSGYKWEAGICEWVAKTPGIAPARPLLDHQRDMSPRSFGETPVKNARCNGENGTESSFSPSDGRIRGGFIGRLPRGPDKPRLTKLNTTTGATLTAGKSPKKIFFSHVRIDGHGLSMCEASPESHRKVSRRLLEIPNSGSHCKQKYQIREKRKNKRETCCLEPEELCPRSAAVVHDLVLESEDELSFL